MPLRGGQGLQTRGEVGHLTPQKHPSPSATPGAPVLGLVPCNPGTFTACSSRGTSGGARRWRLWKVNRGGEKSVGGKVEPSTSAGFWGELGRRVVAQAAGAHPGQSSWVPGTYPAQGRRPPAGATHSLSLFLRAPGFLRPGQLSRSVILRTGSL